MKKVALFAIALGVSAMAMAADQTVTFDFSDSTNPWSLPTEYVTGENTYTNETLSVKINGTGYTDKEELKGGAKFQSTKGKEGLIMGKKNSYLTLPAFDFNVSTIKVYGIESGSGSVAFNVFVGETAVSSAVTGCKTTQTFRIADAYKTAGTIYTIKVTNANNIQISKIEVSSAVDTIHTQGDGTRENPYTIADIMALNNPVDSTCAWVGGYIIGCGNSSGNLITDTAKLVDSNVLLADTIGAEKGCPVQLSKSVQKEIVGVKTHPKNVGEYLLVYGQLTSYLSKCGVKNVIHIDLNGQTDIREVKNAECTMQNGEKRMENGRLVIERNGEKFGALGTKL